MPVSSSGESYPIISARRWLQRETSRLSFMRIMPAMEFSKIDCSSFERSNSALSESFNDWIWMAFFIAVADWFANIRLTVCCSCEKSIFLLLCPTMIPKSLLSCNIGTAMAEWIFLWRTMSGMQNRFSVEKSLTVSTCSVSRTRPGRPVSFFILKVLIDQYVRIK